MGELIVISGPPGAGKSTVAALVAQRFDRAAIVPGDHFFEFVHRGYIDPWLPESEDQNVAVIAAAAASAGHLSRYCPVIYEGVIGPWFRDGFVAKAGVDQIAYAVLLPPLEVCIQRVRDRQGHGFTDLDAAAHMWREFAASDLEPRYRIADESHGIPADIAGEIVRRAADGNLTYRPV